MKLSKLPLAFVGLLYFATSCNTKSENTSSGSQAEFRGTASFEDSSASYIRIYDRDGKVFVQKTNTYYELITAYNGNQPRKMLLKITKAESASADSSQNANKIITVVGRDITESSISDPSYEINVKASEIEFRDNTILFTRIGETNEEDYISRYGLISGKEVFNCSYGGMYVGIPNVKDKRFVGYTSLIAAGKPLDDKHITNLLATINYSSSTQAISTAYLKLKRSTYAESIARYTPEMILNASNPKNAMVDDGKGLILMGADENYKPADVYGFEAVFTFYFGDDNESTQVIIPVENDKLAIEKARYDKNIFELDSK